MNELLGHLPFVFVYIDDILIFSNNKEEHADHLKQVFGILSKSGLKIGLEKCVFMTESIEFLGYHITTKGIRPHPGKCETIFNIEPPETIGALRSFLGTIGFYRRHIENFADIAAPLHVKLAESEASSHKIELNDEELEAFVFLKLKLLDVVENSFIDPTSNLFVVKTTLLAVLLVLCYTKW